MSKNGDFFCGNCGSFRIIHFRHDMDWSGGDLTRLNEDEEYLNTDPSSADEYDIEVTVCLNCKSTDNFKQYAPEIKDLLTKENK